LHPDAAAVPPAPLLVGYGAVFIFLVFAIGFIAVSLLLARVFRPRKESFEKGIAYECGEDPQGTAWVKFNLRFYVVALIFIVFDVEAALLVPWAVVYRTFPDPAVALAEGLLFLLILGAGLAYVWAKGDLDWIKPEDRLDNREVLQWKEAQAAKKRQQQGVAP
jgi:NADH-quinone oxidoreductase subunit A